MKKKYSLIENLSYTPEKEKDLLEQSKKDFESAKKIYGKFYNQVVNLAIQDVLNNKENTQALLERVEEAERAVRLLAKKYADVVDLYANQDELSDTIEELDNIAMKIADIQHELFRLTNTVEAIQEAAEEIEGSIYKPE